MYEIVSQYYHNDIITRMYRLNNDNILTYDCYGWLDGRFSLNYVPKLLIKRTNWKRQRISPSSQILVTQQPMKTADADSDNTI